MPVAVRAKLMSGGHDFKDNIMVWSKFGKGVEAYEEVFRNYGLKDGSS